MTDDDTIVQCKKCWKKQHVNFADALKNGWPLCHGETMVMVFSDADIDKAVKSLPITIKVVRG
jgi:hypothetical protein